MESFERLCGEPGSRLARVARAQLAGAGAALRELLAVLPGDPGADACRAVLRDLDTLLAGGQDPAPAGGHPSATGAAPDRGTAPGAAPEPGALTEPGTVTAPRAAAVPDTVTERRPVTAPGGVPGAFGGDGYSAHGGRDGHPGEDARELAALAADLASGPEAVGGPGPAAVPPCTDLPALWRWFHLALLRLPQARAGAWRDRAARLLAPPPGGEHSGGGRVQWTDWRALDREQVLVPALPAHGVRGLRLVLGGPVEPWAAPQDPGPGAVPPPPGPGNEAPAGPAPVALPAPLPVVAAPPGHGATGVRGTGGTVPPAAAPEAVYSVLAGWVAGLAGLDDQLHHGVESLAHRGMLPLRRPENLRAYRRELALRVSRLAGQPPDSPQALRAALAVDEALCSVVHLPPAAPGSWWAEVAGTSQTTVLELRRRVGDLGADVAVEVPAPSYREARRRTGGNDIPLDAGGRRGQVLAGLRLWARIEGRELPGRVMYRG